MKLNKAGQNCVGWSCLLAAFDLALVLRTCAAPVALGRTSLTLAYTAEFAGKARAGCI